MNDPTVIIEKKDVDKHQPVIAFQEEAKGHSEDPQLLFLSPWAALKKS